MHVISNDIQFIFDLPPTSCHLFSRPPPLYEQTHTHTYIHIHIYYPDRRNLCSLCPKVTPSKFACDNEPVASTMTKCSRWPLRKSLARFRQRVNARFCPGELTTTITALWSCQFFHVSNYCVRSYYTPAIPISVPLNSRLYTSSIMQTLNASLWKPEDRYRAVKAPVNHR